MNFYNLKEIITAIQNISIALNSIKLWDLHRRRNSNKQNTEKILELFLAITWLVQ